MQKTALTIFGALLISGMAVQMAAASEHHRQHLTNGRDYDGSLLIPEVTQLMNDTDDWLNRELNEDRTRFCKRWGDALSEKGLIQRKK